MDKTFLIKLAASVLISGLWISGATILAEKRGSKIGGMVANLPSHLLVSLFFVAIVSGTDYAVAAAPGIPIGMAVNSIFLLVLILTLKYGLTISIILSFIAWLIFTLAGIIFTQDNFIVNIIIYLLVMAGTFGYLEWGAKIRSVERKPKNFTVRQILLRAGFAGTVVAMVIIFSRILDAYVLGIFSVFPAVMFSTMLILIVNQSPAFAQETGKIMIFASTNITVYAVALYFTYPLIGPFWGTAISYLAAFIWVWALHPLVKKFG